MQSTGGARINTGKDQEDEEGRMGMGGGEGEGGRAPVRLRDALEALLLQPSGGEGWKVYAMPGTSCTSQGMREPI